MVLSVIPPSSATLSLSVLNGGATLYRVSKPSSFSSVKTKLCTATLQVTCNPLALASRINSTDLAVEIVGMCNFPPVYSNKNKFLATITSSARLGIPFNPNRVETTPSLTTPLPFIFSSWQNVITNPSKS